MRWQAIRCRLSAVCWLLNAVIDKETAEEINKLFFEVIIAPDYDVDALEILGQKKNRIIFGS